MVESIVGIKDEIRIYTNKKFEVFVYPREFTSKPETSLCRLARVYRRADSTQDTVRLE